MARAGLVHHASMRASCCFLFGMCDFNYYLLKDVTKNTTKSKNYCTGYYSLYDF